MLRKFDLKLVGFIGIKCTQTDRGEDDESYGEEVKSLDFGEEGEERCEDGKGLLFMKWKREDKPITINDGALNYIIKSLNRKIKPQTTMKTHEINS